ncbi:MAG: 7,8-didemethyl-8-hydroxy-5-deazariboflavin synthase CofG [Chloroflexi bacterium]|nr:7,8-didemethyl-8-hydroxy-5-deazariboflavin synthase CofG [Chloroflexota bacterium]
MSRYVEDIVLRLGNPILPALNALLVDARTDLPGEVSAAVKGILGRAQEGKAPSQEEAYRLIACEGPELSALCAVAGELRDHGKGRRVSFSPKVFIPLTQLCRDLCSYCTFRQEPSKAAKIYLTPEEVLAVAKAGERLGCTEALFTLGERPEQRYPEAREWLARRGYRTTLEYLKVACALVLEKTTLLPHANPGTMSRREMASLKEVNASMGLMLESVSPRLYQPGGPHEFAPSKRPAARLKTIELAGQLRVPFTTGILIGIGETLQERVDSIFALKRLHERYGHIQEIIVQNFRAKPDTPMANHTEPTSVDVLCTLAVTRVVFGPTMNIQVPPNLSPRDYPTFLHAGLNDWGGVSPLTIDYVNPEAPWPHLSELLGRTSAEGFNLVPRLPIYPEYLAAGDGFLDASVAKHVRAFADEEGYVRGGMARYVASR